MAISSINIASSTGTNWLKEAQEALDAAENPGGMMGALQNSKDDPGSIDTFLAQSQKIADNLAQINSDTSSQNTLMMQMSDAAQQKLASERQALQQKMTAQQTNYTPPTELDSFIYFDDGTSIDTVNNIMTMSDGTQIDTTTGQELIDSASIINMANGAYLDTKNNVLTMADGTKFDTVTGLKITA